LGPRPRGEFGGAVILEPKKPQIIDLGDQFFGFFEGILDFLKF
jgi:hypothetical protein